VQKLIEIGEKVQKLMEIGQKVQKLMEIGQKVQSLFTNVIPEANVRKWRKNSFPASKPPKMRSD
jgi:hypothetical protein